MTLDQIIHSLTNSETMKTSLAILLTLALSINGLRISPSHRCQVDSGKYSHLSIKQAGLQILKNIKLQSTLFEKVFLKGEEDYYFSKLPFFLRPK